MKDEQARVVAVAERALGVRLGDVTPLSDDKRRNLVLRAATPAGSVIVKATRDKEYDASNADAFESGLVKDWVAAAFLTDHAPGTGPTFFAGDAASGVIVLQDLGAGLGSLVRPLLDGPADRAEQALVAYATAVGRLHAATLSCIDRHADVLRRDFPGATVKPPANPIRWREATAGKVATLMGSTLPDDELALIAGRQAAPGPWRGLAHRDGCPDNVLLKGGSAHLIDFEFAGPGHILLDATYWRLGFPTCWCAGRVPDRLIAAMDNAYRETLAPALPIAGDDDVFRSELAILLVARMFASLSWLLEPALTEDRTWGISTNRPRILWHLEAAIAGGTDVPMLNGLRATAQHWRDDLGRRWPETAPLALYPAFRP